MAQGLDEGELSPKLLDRKFDTFMAVFAMPVQRGVAILEPAIISEM